MKKVSLFTTAAMFALAATVAFGISAIPAKTVKAEGDVQINEDNFPDANFRKWVMDNVDTSSYGTLTQAEISKTKKISIVDGEIDINDISGIEFFTSLESLEIQYTGITSIDVSKNTALKELNCSDNKLTSLDVGKNTALEELYCDECALSYLNVNGCSSLRILVCSDNKLTELDVSRNRQLNRLQCKDNMINTIWLPKEASDFSTFEYDSGANIIVVEEGYISINKTNFPDDEFRAWVIANINNDKEMLSPTDIESVKEIYLGQEGYSDLKGIEFFSELEKLCCSNNYLTNLDISKNLALTYLDCEDNKIKTLDVSNNRALTFLRCDYNQLTSLDVSKNTELTKLDCSDNPLNEIYVRNNTKLKELYCYNNQLVSLDVSQNTDLEVLSCYDNKLIDIDVSKNTALTVLQCGKNGMMILDLSLNKELDYLDCKYNDYLKSIFLAKDPNDVSIIYYDEGVELFGPEGDTIPISRANFPDDNFRVWIIWQTFGSDCLLTKDEIASVKEIELVDKKISNLKGIEFFAALETLNCHNNKLTSLDLSKNTNLVTLICSYNPNLTSLNVSKNIKLDKLVAYINKLTELDVKNNTELKHLDVGNSKLKSLDVSHNTKLEVLHCENVGLTELDISKNTALKELYNRENQFTSLDLSKNTALEKMEVYHNPLKSLDVSMNKELELLFCYDCQLSSLDVSKNTKLESLSCASNPLESIDISKNTKLRLLECSSMGLKKLDLSNNPELCELICCKNPDFKMLDISNNSNLVYLNCSRTGLASLDISRNPLILSVYTDGISEPVFYDKEILGYCSADAGDRPYYNLITDPDLEIITVRKEPTATPTATTVPAKEPTKAPTTVPSKDPTKAPTTAPAKSSISLDKKTASLKCGDKLTLKATLKGATGKITWKSSDTKIATVDSNGKITTKQAGTVTITASAGKVKAACTVTVLYKDVTNTKDFWYAPTNYLTKAGVVKGYDKQTKFKPANDCTRAQMVTFLYRLQGEPKTKSSTCKFKDVKKTDYFFKPVIWAVEKGITTGVSKTKFNPQGVCTRAQTVTFLWRMANKPASKAKTCKFSDVKKKDYFYNPVIWASEKKIVEGYKDNTFRPQGKCLRRQMVTFLYKYDKFVNGKG